jgi:hypothetical protein
MKATLKYLLVCAGAIALGIVLALAPINGHAQTVAQWYALNEHCAGDQLDPDHNPACAKRAKVEKALWGQGYRLHNHDAWTTPEQGRAYYTIMTFYDAQIKANPYEAIDSIMPMMLAELRQHMTDVEIFAFWNGDGYDVRRAWPAAGAVMAVMMRYLEMSHAQSNDVRFSVHN